MKNKITHVERDSILSQYYKNLESYETSQNISQDLFSDKWELESAESENYLLEAEIFEKKYYERLPRVVMSQSPIDGKIFYRSFDPYDFDGLWWRPFGEAIEPPPPRSFCSLTGAVSYGPEIAKTGKFDVYPGPEVPFVIPRLLEYEGMVAVISRLEMENGCIAYPIVYFADRRPLPEELTTPWIQRTHLYRTQLGDVKWKTPKETLDYDLHPWIDKGKLRWCKVDQRQPNLIDKKEDIYPFVDLLGRRCPQILPAQSSVKNRLPATYG